MTVSRFRSRSPEETIEVGRSLGRTLRPGDAVLITGDLGSGKTTLVKGIASGWGVEDPVTSPSFALIHVYGTRERTLVHVDPYRLSGPDDVGTIGLEDYLNTQAVVVVEWAERLGPLAPSHAIHVAIITGTDEVREISISGGLDASALHPSQ